MLGAYNCCLDDVGNAVEEADGASGSATGVGAVVANRAAAAPPVGAFRNTSSANPTTVVAPGSPRNLVVGSGKETGSASSPEDSLAFEES